MNPLSLRLKNVGRFADLDIDLPEGLLAVVGSNGSGKSTLVGAIELALFADGSRDLAGCLSPWADRLEIELTFLHADRLFRLRRGYAKGRSTLDLEECNLDPPWGPVLPTDWQAISRENTAATQAHLCDILGLSRSAFNASAFLSQGNSAAFPEATASERKSLLGTILDPHGFWPKVALQATAERREAEASILVNQGRISDGLMQLNILPDLQKEHHDGTIEHASGIVVVTAREDEATAAQAALSEAQAAAERVRTLTAERDAAKVAEQIARKEHGDADIAMALLGDARKELASILPVFSIPDLEAKVEEQRRLAESTKETWRRKDALIKERDAQLSAIETVAQMGVEAKTKHADLTLQADELEQHPHAEHHCETCGQTLPDFARTRVAEGLREQSANQLLAAQEALRQVETLEQRAADLTVEIHALPIPQVPLDDFSDQLAQARKTEGRRIELGVLIQGYKEKAARLDDLRSAHEVAASDLAAAEAFLESDQSFVSTPVLSMETASLRAAEKQLVDARTALAQIQQRQARLEQQIETLTQLATKVEVMQAEVTVTQKQIDLLKLAERAFGRDGIPALIVESVIGVIEAETNRLLEQMPTSDGETFRVELRTQRALKTADHLKETLDIVVYDRDGERPYETYSGGEQARLNICLRIALALLLADRRGAESRLLVVDELEYLDALGQEQLIDVIQSVSHRFDRTIVVSHHPGIRDAFDNTLRVVKDDGVSRVLPSDGDSKVAA